MLQTSFLKRSVQKWTFLLLMMVTSCSRDDNFKQKTFFFGDSHIERWDLQYFFPEFSVSNNGVGGAKIKNIQNQIETSLAQKNSKCFLEIGTNDIRSAINTELPSDSIVSLIVNQYKELLDLLSPQFSQINVIGIIPLNQYIGLNTSEIYYEVNTQLDDLIATYQNIHFLDIYPALTDEKKYLRSSFTQDGLHLNNNGYEQLSNEVRSTIY